MFTSRINRAPTARHRQDNCTQSAFVSRMSICSTALLGFLLLTVQVAAQEDSLAEKAGIETAQKDSLPEKTGMEAIQVDIQSDKADTEADQKDSLPKNTAIEPVKEDAPLKNAGIEPVKEDALPKKDSIAKSELVNIVLKNRRVRPYGWGEYRVGGRCLCCDNKNDGDCIVVHTIERTNRLRITQIIDGKIEGDTSNIRSYFGNLKKRDRPERVTTLMVDMPLGKVYEIEKVIVYTMINKEKHTNFLSNCELGYYDQFNRLQWTGKVQSTKFDEPITFEMENPVLTKKIMLRVKGGKNRITEVAIFSENKMNEKP